ncbi:hypothetical protein CDL15_Pgr012090 [Punica granatum]|uniref:Uncharacterized protein n=1 Tax=Punica granatum TaxID=22663 RepID=A0A218XM23_PUNGR|nr:hypothetical protein CDL15_Pgr012090 [Punica granatum]
MPTVLAVTMAIGCHRLSQQGAITTRITAYEDMARMDVLCSDKTGPLTLNKLSVDKNLIEVFGKDVTDMDTVILLAVRAARVENQDAIAACIVGMLGDPKEAREGTTELHFLPFNPVDKRTAITYIDSDGNWHRDSKGAPERIIELCKLRADVKNRVHASIDRFFERDLHSLAVATQEVPEKTKESGGGPWKFVGLLPLFDPPRHDSAEAIRLPLDLGVNVKIIVGDQLAIEHKYEIVKKLPERKHICGMTGDGVNDVPALKAIFQSMKSYTIYAISITIHFVLLALVWKYDFPRFMVLIIAVLNEGTVRTISKDRVKPSPGPYSWELGEIFATGIVLGTYLAIMTVVFFRAAHKTDFFSLRTGHINTNKPRIIYSLFPFPVR